MMIDLLKVSGFTFIVVFLLIYILQRNLIYFPTKEVPQQSHYHATDLQALHLKTKDGINLLAWYKAAQANQPTVLYLHGNAGHIGHRMFLARAFVNAGFGVLLLEYRGYGGNQGHPTEEGFYRDASTAIQFLQQKNVSFSHLVLYGESLGTGVAVKMAQEFPACSIVLQSPYTSLSALAKYHYPWIFLKPWDKYDSLAQINQIKSPLLILHGKQDQLVPFDQALTLFNQANEPKKLIAFAGKGHNDLWDAAFSQAVIDFIQSHCHPNGTP